LALSRFTLNGGTFFSFFGAFGLPLPLPLSLLPPGAPPMPDDGASRFRPPSDPRLVRLPHTVTRNFRTFLNMTSLRDNAFMTASRSRRSMYPIPFPTNVAASWNDRRG